MFKANAEIKAKRCAGKNVSVNKNALVNNKKGQEDFSFFAPFSSTLCFEIRRIFQSLSQSPHATSLAMFFAESC